MKFRLETGIPEPLSIEELNSNPDFSDQRIVEIGLDPYGNMGNGMMRLILGNNKTIEILDGGQSCCESRYMTCDDDLGQYIGATVKGISRSEANVKKTGYYDDEHETVFISIKTNLGTITMTTHNEHNGYYDGFDLEAYMKSTA